ncbi:MAG: C25 family cysteine peptidase [Chloroflexi bacterium OHK40]
MRLRLTSLLLLASVLLAALAWPTAPASGADPEPQLIALALPAEADATPSPGSRAVLVREGWLRGQRVGVYALEGATSIADASAQAALANALVPGARPFAATSATLDSAPFATGAPPPDPVVAGQAWRITVTAAGIQAISAAALAANGLDLGQIDPSRLRLYHRGAEVALEVLEENGTVAGLRFYAEPGDRWNATSIYWLTLGQASGLRMERRSAQPTGAPVTNTALERGVWRTNTILETRLPGPDGDHFFSADLRVVSAGRNDPPPQPAGATAPIATTLPPVPGAATLTVGGGSVSSRSHTLQVSFGGTQQTYQWAGTGTWTAQLSFSAPGASTSALVELRPLRQPDGSYLSDSIHVDSVAWELPVALTLAEQGARFVGQAGQVGYQLNGMPAGASVYDVSDPARPARLSFSGDTFEASAATPQVYLVTGPGTLHEPTVTAHSPTNLAQPLNTEAVYIAPGAFLSALEPLLEHRRTQGLSVAAVATEAIYDAWSGGHVSPEAIRSFLRYAAENWDVAPKTVVLVGDGSADPRNYLGRNNITWVPPYLAPVDPWLGETACEACYAQLHGDDPLADGLPDLTFGRIPAKSADEAAALVAKILGYERSNSLGAWRATVAFVADNTDLGGDFAAAAEASMALQPAQARIYRVAYDPQAPAGDPWRERDPLRALARSMGAFNAGAAVVHYVGHGLQFQWAYTGPPLGDNEPDDKQYLLGLFSVDELQNGPWLPVVLSMTCLTGSFQIPAFSGTAIDERLVARPDGGAIAAWSSTGLGVLYGHDALQRGFYRALWAAPGQARLGELTMAGYVELFTQQQCCQESINTFALLGDPLTAPQIRLDQRYLSLPLAAR